MDTQNSNTRVESTPLQSEWRLPEAIFRGLHQWPIIIIFCLIGGLLGWGASFLWPPSYRTQSDISVILNPYRTYSDSQFLALVYPQYTNIDDYKNWQMSQLSAALFSDKIIQPTLDELRQEDSYWNDVTPSQLIAMLNAEWRTAGIWSLYANSKNAKHSNQAVRAWSRNAVSGIKQALSASEQLIQVDEAQKNIIAEQSRTTLSLEDYQTSRQLLQDWLKSTSALPQDQPLSTTDRWRILYLAGRLSQFSPAWISLLNSQPAQDALPQAYMDWVNQILAAIDAELPALQQRSDNLDQRHTQLAQSFDSLQQASLGLSPNLAIKSVEKTLPEVIRPTVLMVLVGAVIGFLAWVYWFLASLSLPKRKR